jgi:hypothetical protein
MVDDLDQLPTCSRSGAARRSTWMLGSLLDYEAHYRRCRPCEPHFGVCGRSHCRLVLSRQSIPTEFTCVHVRWGGYLISLVSSRLGQPVVPAHATFVSSCDRPRCRGHPVLPFPNARRSAGFCRGAHLLSGCSRLQCNGLRRRIGGDRPANLTPGWSGRAGRGFDGPRSRSMIEINCQPEISATSRAAQPVR